MIKLTEDNRMLGYELLSSFPNISHFTTTRNGGYGYGNYASFNCTGYTGDDPENVRRNQSLLLSSLPPVKQLVIPRQVHDTRIYTINSPECVSDEVLDGIDALITDQQGFCLCISTADCIPLLLYDTRKHVIAAIHAGWRGTVNGITSKVIREMQHIYTTDAADILACIGPGISLQSFEVGEEVYESFRDKDFPIDRISLWNAVTGKHHIDLWEANRMQLEECGIPASNIQCAGICTFQEHETFFSARRLGIASGRILSGIMLKASPQPSPEERGQEPGGRIAQPTPSPRERVGERPFTITVSDKIKQVCPIFAGAAVYANVSNTLHNEDLWKEIHTFTQELTSETTMEQTRLHPVIAATRQVYKKLGKDPGRYRPSAEALRRRLLRGIPLYQIDTLVDLINLVSLRTGYSIGGFDAGKIQGTTLTLGVGEAGECFEAIGRGQLNIEGLPVYRDDIGGIGTPTSDEERTKLDLSTSHILAVINGYSGKEGLSEAAGMISDLLKKYAGSDEVNIYYF